MMVSVRKTFKASLTVEAALVLPIFVYAIVLLTGIYKLVRCQEFIQEGITQSVRAAAGYGRVVTDLEEFIEYDEFRYADILNTLGVSALINEVTGSTYFNLTTDNYLETDKLKKYGVKDGYKGLSFEGSSLKDEDGYTSLCCSYVIALQVPIFGSIDVDMEQKAKMLSFCGYKVESRFEEVEAADEEAEEEKTEDVVYVTETGKVYHESRNCRHLKVNIKSTTFDKVDSLRNEHGAKYYYCGSCCNDTLPAPEDTVYVTTDGRNYHININCGGLKRTIKAINRSEVGSRSQCKTCKIN